MNSRLALFTALLVSTSALAAEPAKVGVVGAADDHLTASAAGKVRALKIGDAIYLGDKLATADGPAQILFLDRSTLTLKPKSDITVDTFVYDPATKDGTMTMAAAKGAFRFVGGALTKKKPVEISTPVGTIGIRGGIVDGNIDGGGGTDAVFVYGEALTLTNADGRVTTTDRYGSGFTLSDAHQLPVPLSAASIGAHFSTFRPAPGSAGLGGASASGKPSLGTEEKTPVLHRESTGPGGEDHADVTASSDASGSSPAASSGQAPTDSPDGGGTSATAPVAASPAPVITTSSPAVAALPVATIAPIQTADLRSIAGTSQTDLVARNESPASATITPAASPSTSTTPTVTAPAAPVASVPIATSPSIAPVVAPTPVVVPVAPVVDQPVVSNPSPPLEPPVVSNPTPPAEPPVASNPTPTEPPPTSNPSTPSEPPVVSNPSPSVPPVTSNPAPAPNDTTTATQNYTHGGTFVRVGATGNRIESGAANAYRTSADTGRVVYSLGGNDPTTVDRSQASAGQTSTSSGETLYNRSAETVSYASPNDSMFYRRTLAANGDQISGIVGTRVVGSGSVDQAAVASAQAASATNGVAFYDFLPDLTVLQKPGERIGTFDWNPASREAFSGFGQAAESLATRDAGLMIDWNRDKFLATNLVFVPENGISSVTSAFGTTMRNQSGSYGNGSLYTARSDGSFGKGSLTASSLYGTAQTGIDGIVLEEGSNTGTASRAGMTPAVLSSGSAAIAGAVNDRTFGTARTTLNGFAAGIVSEPDGSDGRASTVFYSGRSGTGVTLTPDATTGSVAGTLALGKNSGNSTSLTAAFGGPGGKSAYLGDKVWAARQTGMANTGRDVNGGEADGVLVSGSYGSNVAASALCRACAYTQWGVWSGHNGGTEQTRTAATAIPVVVGQMTQNLGTSGLAGTANYSGPAFGNVQLDNGPVVNAVGTMKAGVDLGARRLNSLNVDFAQGSLPNNETLSIAKATPVSIATTGAATFAANGLTVTRGGNSVNNGTAVGALFGPQAQEIGGNFAATSNAIGVKAAGVFQGKR